MINLSALMTKFFIIAATKPQSVFEKTIKGVFDYEQVSRGLRKLIAQLGPMIKNPRKYPQEFVILIAAAFLIFLVIMLSVVVFYTVRKQIQVRKAYRKLALKITPEAFTRRLVILGSAILLIVATIAIAAAAPSFCYRCHTNRVSYDQWSKSVHREVKCIDCHYSPGAFGYAIGTFNGAGNLADTVFKPPMPLQAIVTNSTCLQCHSDINKGIVAGEREIKMRHSDIVSAGIPCTDCHGSVAHKAKQAQTFSMNICVNCHNGKTAKSDCKVCHDKDIAYAPHTTLDDWPKVQGTIMTCTGCHSVKISQGCVNCHGLELPHSEVFRQKHAMQAETKYSLCYKCHWKKGMSSNKMCGCHSEGEIHGDPAKWYFDHREFASGNGAGCNCHRTTFCGRCHDNAIDVLPSSYAGGAFSGMR